MTIKKTRMINRRALKLGIADLAGELQDNWCDNDLKLSKDCILSKVFHFFHPYNLGFEKWNSY